MSQMSQFALFKVSKQKYKNDFIISQNTMKREINRVKQNFIS